MWRRSLYGAIGARGAGAAAFSPLDLSPIAWYDPSDLTTLFQDSGATTPVTADGDVVGYIGDKSGNGNHFVQVTASKKMLYKTDGTLHWLLNDNVDDCMVSTATVDMTGSDEMTLVYGGGIDNDAGWNGLIEASPNWTTSNGTFALGTGTGAGTTTLHFGSRGTANSTSTQYVITPGATKVVTALAKIATDTSILRVNAAQVASGANDQGTGNYGNHTLYLGLRNGTVTAGDKPWEAPIYSLIILPAMAAGADLTNIETWVAEKSGVTL